eukprot:6176999-Pleurochrysis_carterae.AAC.3
MKVIVVVLVRVRLSGVSGRGRKSVGRRIRGSDVGALMSSIRIAGRSGCGWRRRVGDHHRDARGHGVRDEHV